MTHQPHNGSLYTCSVEAEDPDSYATGDLFPVKLGDCFKSGRYKVLHKLGCGGFATVWLARDGITDTNVALKFINTTLNDREHRILVHLQSSDVAKEQALHPGRDVVVQLLDDFQVDDKHLCLVLEVLGDDLQSRVETEEHYRLPRATTQSIMHRVALGIDYLWKCGVAHGDLHTRNILFEAPTVARQSEAEVMSCLDSPQRGTVRKFDDTCLDSGIPPYLVSPVAFWGDEEVVKIADLGNAFFHDDPPSRLSNPWPVRAPESVLGQPIDKYIDMWGLGCLYFEVITGRTMVDSFMADKTSVIKDLTAILGSPPEAWLKNLDAETLNAINLSSAMNMSFDRYFTLNYDHDDSQFLTDEEWEIRVKDYEKPSREFSDRDLHVLGDMLKSLLRYEPHSRATPNEVLEMLSNTQTE